MKKYETPEQRTKFMDNLISEIELTLSVLWSRWQDEKEYEDIKDYENVLIEKVKPFGITEISLNKTFLIKLTVPGFPYNPYIKVKSKSITWSSKPL